MGFVRVSVTLATLPIFLAGCVTNESFGTGPIQLDRTATTNFEAYKKLPRPMHFALSVDGKASYGIYCADYRCGDETIASVLSECEARSGGVPCKIFANGKTIVWNGLVSFSSGG